MKELIEYLERRRQRHEQLMEYCLETYRYEEAYKYRHLAFEIMTILDHINASQEMEVAA